MHRVLKRHVWSLERHTILPPPLQIPSGFIEHEEKFPTAVVEHQQDDFTLCFIGIEYVTEFILRRLRSVKVQLFYELSNDSIECISDGFF